MTTAVELEAPQLTLTQYIENAPAMYRQLVIDTAQSGKTITMSPETFILLSSTGRNARQLLADVQRVQERFAAVAEIEAAEARRPELAAAAEAAAAEWKKLREVQAECDRKLKEQQRATQDAVGKEANLKSVIDSQIGRARSILWNSADPAIEEEIRAAEREVERLKSIRNSPADEPQYARRIDQAERQFTPSKPPHDSGYDRSEQIEQERQAAVMAEFAKCREELEGRIQEKEKSYATIRELKLDPLRFKLT